ALIPSVDSSHNFSSSVLESTSRSSLSGLISPPTISLRPGTPMASNSLARAEKVRIPPIENSKSSFSGKASITRRVKPRLPCHIASIASDEITSLMIVFVLFIKQNYHGAMTTYCQQVLINFNFHSLRHGVGNAGQHKPFRFFLFGQPFVFVHFHLSF